MTFDHTADPDYADGGEPVLVVYTWSTAEVDVDGNVTGTPTVVQTSIGSPSPLILTQAHVGMHIQASVQYYELGTDGMILAAQDGGTAVTMAAVENIPNDASAHFVLTTSGTMLMADVEITDADGVPAAADAVTYTWESSFGGETGWSEVPTTMQLTRWSICRTAAVAVTTAW